MSLFLTKFIKLDPDPDPQKMNADPQPWYQEIKSTTTHPFLYELCRTVYSTMQSWACAIILNVSRAPRHAVLPTVTCHHCFASLDIIFQTHKTKLLPHHTYRYWPDKIYAHTSQPSSTPSGGHLPPSSLQSTSSPPTGEQSHPSWRDPHLLNVGYSPHILYLCRVTQRVIKKFPTHRKATVFVFASMTW